MEELDIKKEICNLIYDINFAIGGDLADDFDVDVSACDGDEDEMISKICNLVPFKDLVAYLDETTDILESDEPRVYYEFEDRINSVYSKIR